MLVAFVTDDYLRREELDGPEVYALYLLAAVGAVVMGSANDLIVLFLGLEIMSIAFYVMSASHRRRIESQESGIKYFILGGFSSAFFLYGIAMVYGSAGTTNFTGIVDYFNNNIPAVRHDGFVLAGVVGLLLVGLGFKTASVPFHFWTPDVPMPTPGHLVHGVGGQGGGVRGDAPRADLRPAALARRLPPDGVGARGVDRPGRVGDGCGADRRQADAGVLLGQSRRFRVGGCRGRRPHRRPARRRRRHPVSAAVPAAVLGVVVGTFAVVTMVGRTGDAATDLSAFRGLSKSHPGLAVAMTVLLLAQAGVPLTSGFVAKFGVIQAAVEVRSYALAIIAMLARDCRAYLRIMVSMWITEKSGDVVANDRPL